MSRLVLSVAAGLFLILAGPTDRLHAQPPPTHVKDGFYKGSRQAAGRLAVEALGVKEKFPFAEVTPDGNVRGWNERSSALVLTFPTPDPDRTHVLAITTSDSTDETARLGVAVIGHITSGTDDPKAPTRIAPKDGKLPVRPATLTWKGEDRPATPALRHFGNAAAIAMEKKGFGTKPTSSPLVFGATKEKAVMAFLASTSNGQAYGIHVVTACFGEETADKLTADLLSQIVKILFE
jgi:hypothetical protein